MKTSNKGKVFCCYPCTGKTSTGGEHINWPEGTWSPVVDMETSLMRTEGYERPENWVIIYVNYVQQLVEQGVNVFCSTHLGVRKELEKRHIEYVNVFPSLNIKDYWLCKLRDRWKKDPCQKNLLAYERAMEHYDEDVGILKNHDDWIEINIKSGYQLGSVLVSYLNRHTKKWSLN